MAVIYLWFGKKYCKFLLKFEKEKVCYLSAFRKLVYVLKYIKLGENIITFIDSYVRITSKHSLKDMIDLFEIDP